MASLIASVNLPSTPLSASVAKTCVQVAAPANQRVKVRGFAFTFDSTSTTPGSVQLRILRQTDAGASLQAATPAPLEPELTETVQATAKIGSQSTQTEPTAGVVLETHALPITSGLVFSYAPDEMPIIGGGGRIGFELTAPSGVSLNARGRVLIEE